MATVKKELPRSVEMVLNELTNRYAKEVLEIFSMPAHFPKETDPIKRKQEFIRHLKELKACQDTFLPQIHGDLEVAINQFKKIFESKTRQLLENRNSICDDFSFSNGYRDPNVPTMENLTIFLRDSLIESGIITKGSQLPLERHFTNSRILISPYFDTEQIPGFCNQIGSKLFKFAKPAILNQTNVCYQTEKEIQEDLKEEFYTSKLKSVIEKISIGEISFRIFSVDELLLFIKSYALNKRIITRLNNTIVDESYNCIIEKYRSM